jgi:hypothetical protein
MEAADLGPVCWFFVSRWALAPVVGCGEATKPGLAPNGSLKQQSPRGRVANPDNLARRSGTQSISVHFRLTIAG